MNAVHNKQHVKYEHNFGPHNSAPNTNGFHDHLILPTGGGKNGFVLGSFLAAPDAIANAFSFGHICNDIATAPIGVT